MILPTKRQHRPTPVKNRLPALLCHVPRYAFRGSTRLAKDAGVSLSAVTRLMRGEGQPDYLLIYRIAEALARELGHPIDIREIAVPVEEEFPTTYPCALFGCHCLPPWAFNGEGEVLPHFSGVPPGTWTMDYPASPNLLL